jgi:hypothetical protein
MKNTESRSGSLLVMLIVLIMVGCTVIPKPIKTRTASMSETGQMDSGYLGSLPDRSGIFTSNAVKRYNLLARDFGDKVFPPVIPGDGVSVFTNGTFRIDAYHRVKFGEMNLLYRESLR